MRKLRRSLGICRGVCASRASLSAFAVAFAQAAQVSRRLPWRLRKPRKSRGICRGVCASRASLAVFAVGCLRTPRGFAAQGFAAQGFAAPGFRRPGGSPRGFAARGFAPPGFRPGLWSTGPTARPGTGERPVGAPDHSQGRNPWCVDDRGETPGGGRVPVRPVGAPDHSQGRNPWRVDDRGETPGRGGYGGAPPRGI